MATSRLLRMQQYKAFQSKINPLLNKRESQLVQEFSFWPSSPPKQLGGIYEMRIYDLVSESTVRPFLDYP